MIDTGQGYKGCMELTLHDVSVYIVTILFVCAVVWFLTMFL